MSEVIKTENLTYTYSENTPFEKTAIENINITVQKGDFVGIIGHTGSGKSTLIQHFNGLLKPMNGKIFVDGIDIWEDKKNLKATRFDVGLVFQYPEYQLFEETVYKDIAFGPKNMGLSEQEIDERVCEALKFVGLPENLKEKSPFDLSGGQKRRVAIAGVIAMRPKVLILDEPTAGLDPKGREKILQQIKNYHEKEQNTVILVSHSMEDIARFSKKILVMAKSRVSEYDTTSKIFEKSEKLEKLGLGVPQITKVFLELNKLGYNFKKDIFTPEQAEQELICHLKPSETGEGV